MGLGTPLTRAIYACDRGVLGQCVADVEPALSSGATLLKPNVGAYGRGVGALAPDERISLDAYDLYWINIRFKFQMEFNF